MKLRLQGQFEDCNKISKCWKRKISKSKVFWQIMNKSWITEEQRSKDYLWISMERLNKTTTWRIKSKKHKFTSNKDMNLKLHQDTVHMKKTLLTTKNKLMIWWKSSLSILRELYLNTKSKLWLWDNKFKRWIIDSVKITTNWYRIWTLWHSKMKL